MKAAAMADRPNFALMKLNDVISFYHLQMPRWLFADSRYSRMQLETKVAYTFLLNRFQLSRTNGWVNDSGEVFIIFTREDLAREMQVSYRKAIACFQELARMRLIWERRLGRGHPNQIYLAAVTLSVQDAAGHDSAPFSPNARPAKSAHLPEDKTCENGMSGIAETAHPDMPKLQANKTEDKKIDKTSPSVSGTDGDELAEILKRCELSLFSPQTAGLFEHAVTRLFYAAEWRVDRSLLPQPVIRKTLRGLDGGILRDVEEKLTANTGQQIRNTMAYTMTVILNEIWESEADLLLDPDLNTMAAFPPGKEDSG